MLSLLLFSILKWMTSCFYAGQRPVRGGGQQGWMAEDVIGSFLPPPSGFMPCVPQPPALCRLALPRQAWSQHAGVHRFSEEPGAKSGHHPI